jgi:NAD(P)-dependent dehydrogenase (short-subunit alcohol dehydrogenase family)/tripartite-type tricarboxylate transporter receptor subunit TctC
MLRSWSLIVSLLVAVGLAGPVQAQGFPSKNLTVVVSIGAGTGMDIVARLYAEKLAAVLGKPVVVENKPGAATMLAATQVAQSPPDGHTLVVLTSSALAINQWLYKQINYNPDADFTPISLYVKSPLILVVNPDLPIKSVPEFIAHAKKASPPMSYVSVGAGGFQHITMEFAKQRFGFEANHVPYRNTGQSVADLIAGHVNTGFVEAGASIPAIKDGKLRALAVSSSTELPLLPGVPPFARAAGVPDFESVSCEVGYAGREDRIEGQSVVHMTGRLQDKVALVAGAGCVGPGWGNGRAIAVRFAQEDAKVFAVDKNSDAMKETLDRVAEFGGTIRQHTCDVTDSGSVKSMIDACMAAFGRVDILVNNVGGSAAGGPVELSEEAFDAQIDYNLKSVFLACKHVIPIMEKQGGGSIINLASTSGLRWTGSPQIGYATSKAAVIHLTHVVAVQYANKGIRVNTVIPGQLHTPMVEVRLAKQRTGGDVDKLLASRVKRVPVGFVGDGRDTANAALFLASDEARFVTGIEIVVDGGMIARCD